MLSQRVEEDMSNTHFMLLYHRKRSLRGWRLRCVLSGCAVSKGRQLTTTASDCRGWLRICGYHLTSFCNLLSYLVAEYGRREHRQRVEHTRDALKFSHKDTAYYPAILRPCIT
jgi:hypothetical protein